ncbi:MULTISPECIES: RHS repeat-associated core domain-containing protein [Pseudomonas]|uniref:RHS repeat-associated core domain-containing protein n=1 Tax=Pseudomonas TaxID=286 RepID=UPI001CEE00FF|nr:MULTISPECIES: RHS repeat-associated core domain-containing protein [Pseudomonas]
MATYLFDIDQQQSLLHGPPDIARAYPPYGALNDAQGPRLAFCGQHRDAFTGYYLLGNGHRCYNPILMRFASPDTLSPFGRGGKNAYAYCEGDPINRSDPSGRSAEDHLLPAMAILANALGLFVSGLRLRSLHKQRVVSRRGVDSAAPLASPERSDWMISGISAASSAAGLVVGVIRTAEPNTDWQIWGLAALTAVSIGTTAYEAWTMAAMRPWQPAVELIGMELLGSNPQVYRPRTSVLSGGPAVQNRRPSAASIRLT